MGPSNLPRGDADIIITLGYGGREWGLQIYQGLMQISV